MMPLVGQVLLVLAACVSLCNFYLSFVRWPLYRLLGKDVKHESGIPLVGTVLLVLALLLSERTTLTWIIALVSFLLDTGGLLWFVVMLVVMVSIGRFRK